VEAAAAFSPVDRAPFDFFDEAGHLFVNGRYDPSQRLLLTYDEQLDARIRFHREFRTDLIFDVPVFIPTDVPHTVRLFDRRAEVFAPDPVLSSVSGMAWNAMPPKVTGRGLVDPASSGAVTKEILWDNGARAVEMIDLSTGTTDVAECAFSSVQHALDNIVCLAGNLEAADFQYVEKVRRQVGNDVMLSGTILEPFSAAGWYLGVERLMYAAFDEREKLRELLESLTQVAAATGLSMIEHGLDMIRVGAATSCILSPVLYREFSLPFQRELVDTLQTQGALVHLHLCGRIKHLLHLLPETGAAILETITPPPLGDTTLAEAKQTAGRTMCLKGNLNPTGALLRGSPKEALQEATSCVEVGSRGGGFIFSVADNLAPGTPQENIAAVAQLLYRATG
jgi:hypothetical protein